MIRMLLSLVFSIQRVFQHFFLTLQLKGYIRLFLSEDILKEYEEILMRPKFDFSRRLVKSFLRKLRAKGKVVRPKGAVNVLKDPADNKFLECAFSGKAEYLITGNTRHFPFGEFKGIKIVSPKEFWEIYNRESTFFF